MWQAGDTVVVHLLNRVAFPVTFITSGLNDSAAGTAQIAAPGQLVTYQLTVPAEVCSDFIHLNTSHFLSSTPATVCSVRVHKCENESLDA